MTFFDPLSKAMRAAGYRRKAVVRHSCELYLVSLGKPPLSQDPADVQ